MKIKLDENLPSSLADDLALSGHDVHTSQQEGLSGKSDLEIWDRAQEEHRFLITQDLNFSDTRRFSPSNHHGILIVRLHSPSGKSLAARVNEVFANEDTTKWNGCFVVVTDYKIRVRRPHTK